MVDMQETSGAEALPLAELLVADSRFLGFVQGIETETDAQRFQQTLKEEHPKAAHIAMIWRGKDGDGAFGFDEDDEPPNSVWPPILAHQEAKNKDRDMSLQISPGIAIAIVRYFGGQYLLGVTCGRLSKCYESIVRDTLHRHQHGPNVPLHQRLDASISESTSMPLYGMAAGDCELHFNIVPGLRQSDGTAAQSTEASSSNWRLLEQIRNELDFDGFQGSEGEVLPRLQNLQATGTDQGIIPVYRYPGNYHGQEWETFAWGPTSLQIKTAVESSLMPWMLVMDSSGAEKDTTTAKLQLNHCVTNYYRNGPDFIGHHSDKTLDLLPNGVIISVSLGDVRILELRRRAAPHDTTRIPLPAGSMLILGPHTNRLFTHSILPVDGVLENDDVSKTKNDEAPPRISLTFRHVTTYLDQRVSGRLFGQGVSSKTLKQVRRRYVWEQVGWWGLFVGSAMTMFTNGTTEGATSRQDNKLWVTLGRAVGCSLLGTSSLRYAYHRWYRYKEEQAARAFFSKASLSGTKY